VIAVSDAMSDAMGIHLSEEADPESTRAHIWAATLWTFIAKFVVSISFSLPLLWMPLKPAVIVGIAWGLIIITVMSYLLARLQQAPVWRAIGEHLAIALVVIAVSHYVGIFTRSVLV
jgi:VIT1/CCC1 family predicted Fe2+/Mn2+ transporter